MKTISAVDTPLTETILIVDDDQTFLQVLARSVRRKGYDAITADSVDRARLLLNRHTPTMAVVDLKMQGESGLGLIPDLKDLNPGMTIIVLTGYASIATVVAAMRLGAQDYLCKPADTHQIISALTGQKPETSSDTLLNQRLSNKIRSAEATIPESPMTMDQVEWEHLQKVLQENHGNISATARSLGMHRRTLQRKLSKHTKAIVPPLVQE